MRNHKRILDYLMEHPCVDCGESDPLVLDFDHLDPKTKTSGISQLIKSTKWQRVLDEIAKCVVRCANCHRRRTAKQRGWYKAIILGVAA